ncbi:MAG: helix-turn-helix transcriptional regulator [Sulfitobacter sp.]|nr:helix-turn-helix transcriptional regulator [Sulfitobacter sp.]
MAFADRLTTLRKDRQLTQAALAERANTHVTQIRRYEAGTSTPTLDVLRNLALALNTSADSLLFDEHERGPADDLTLHLEAINHLNKDDQDLIRSIIEAILLRHDTRRWTHAS